MPLPLYCKITEQGFCSAAHRTEFHTEQSRMVLERLRESHNQIARAAVPLVIEPEPIETESPVDVAIDDTETARFLAAVGAHDEPVSNDPPLAALMSIEPHGRSMQTPDIIAADPIAYEPAGDPVHASMPVHRLHAPELPATGRVDLPLRLTDNAASAGFLAQPVDRKRQASIAIELPQRPSRPVVAPQIRATGELRKPGRFDPVEGIVDRHADIRAIPPRSRTWLPLSGERVESPEAGPPVAGLRQLKMQGPSEALAPPPLTADPAIRAGAAGVELPAPTAFSGSSTELSVCDQMVPLLPPSPADVPGHWNVPTPIAAEAVAIAERRPGTSGLSLLAGRLAAPALVSLRQNTPIEPPLTWGIRGAGLEPAISLEPVATPRFAAPRPAAALTSGPRVAVPAGSPRALPQTPGMTPRAAQAPEMFPGSRVYPKQVFTLQELDGEDFLTLVASLRPAAVAATALDTARYLRAASRGIQLMAIAVPVLLFVAFRPAPAHDTTSAVPGPVGRMINSRMTAVRSALQNRAGIEYLDDFRMGLDNWNSSGDLTRSWSYDRTGFVQPGPLALYRPSLGMADYQFEFLGQIDRRAVGWVFRARDLNNYQVAKLVMMRPGPLPTIGIERYAVINGRPGPRVQEALPLSVHQDTVYRVRMEVRGADFALYVQNQLVHFWSDARIMAGGVGFFSAHGEQSRIRWMQISHQYDALGRLCAYFAPMAVMTYNIEPTMGAGVKQ